MSKASGRRKKTPPAADSSEDSTQSRNKHYVLSDKGFERPPNPHGGFRPRTDQRPRAPPRAVRCSILKTRGGSSKSPEEQTAGTETTRFSRPPVRTRRRVPDTAPRRPTTGERTRSHSMPTSTPSCPRLPRPATTPPMLQTGTPWLRPCRSQRGHGRGASCRRRHQAPRKRHSAKIRRTRMRFKAEKIRDAMNPSRHFARSPSQFRFQKIETGTTPKPPEHDEERRGRQKPPSGASSRRPSFPLSFTVSHPVIASSSIRPSRRHPPLVIPAVLKRESIRGRNVFNDVARKPPKIRDATHHGQIEEKIA